MISIKKILFLICITGIPYSLYRDIHNGPVTESHHKKEAETYRLHSKKETPPHPFVFDGCTGFPDTIFRYDFTEACLEHDIAYWLGGTSAERKEVDTRLAQAAAADGLTGTVFGIMLYAGTRTFGDSFIAKALGTNWGFGYNGTTSHDVQSQ